MNHDGYGRGIHCQRITTTRGANAAFYRYHQLSSVSRYFIILHAYRATYSSRRNKAHGAHAAAGQQAQGGMIRIGKPTLHVID